MRIIGLSGTNGSGKDTVGELLAKSHGYLFVSLTDMLRVEAKKRGLSPEREVLRTISAEWRRGSGLGVLIDKALAYYESKGGDTSFSGLVMASLRNPGEVVRVHELGGKVIWIDADPRVRYARISARQRVDDQKSYDQFLSEEQTEMQHSGDEATLSGQDVKRQADVEFINEFSSINELEKSLSELIKKLSE